MRKDVDLLFNRDKGPIGEESRSVTTQGFSSLISSPSSNDLVVKV